PSADCLLAGSTGRPGIDGVHADSLALTLAADDRHESGLGDVEGARRDPCRWDRRQQERGEEQADHEALRMGCRWTCASVRPAAFCPRLQLARRPMERLASASMSARISLSIFATSSWCPRRSWPGIRPRCGSMAAIVDAGRWTECS